MKLLVTIKPEHFQENIWGDVDCNPVSEAIADALGRPGTSVCIRTVRKTLAPVNYTCIPLPGVVEELFRQWCWDELPPDTQFEINIPPEWITK